METFHNTGIEKMIQTRTWYFTKQPTDLIVYLKKNHFLTYNLQITHLVLSDMSRIAFNKQWPFPMALTNRTITVTTTQADLCPNKMCPKDAQRLFGDNLCILFIPSEL